MSRQADIAREFYQAIQSGMWRRLEQLLGDDFVAHGLTAEPLDRRQFIDAMLTLHDAFPDLRFDAHDYQPLADGVWLTTRLSGTHRGRFVSPFGGTVEPTHRRFELPDERPRLKIEGDTILALDVEAAESGGLDGIFEQLGIESPFRPQLSTDAGEPSAT